MHEPSNMKGKAALVTGAAAGLGRATALRLARAGADVCVVDVNEAGLAETARELKALGVRSLVHLADLSRRENCRPAVEAAVDAFSRLDALCNVAAVFIPCHAHDMLASDFEKTVAVNLAAPFYLMQAAIPYLLTANGAVVNVTSCAAFTGQAYLAAYSATKAALTHMTKSLAMEYMHQPIRFNAVAPGGMATALAGNMRSLPADADVSLVKRFAPLRGLVEIDDVAAVVAFLASDAARGYHGACISIDKGIVAG